LYAYEPLYSVFSFGEFLLDELQSHDH